MKKLKELEDLNELMELADKELVSFQERTHISHNGSSYPITSFEIGSKDLDAPVLALYGGIHGLEKVGTHVVTSFLYGLFKQLEWDDDLRSQLKTSRIISIPLINPVGMANNWRCNGNGVDLMRNCPIDADKKNLPFLIGGHRHSKLLPWFRGEYNTPMEQEVKTVYEYAKEQTFRSDMIISIDFHSGFGLKDRFWYPYAKTTERFPSIDEVHALKNLIDDNLPHHIYKIEPQSLVYTTHGDLWDYLYDEHRELHNGKKLYLPWTLEMGSWNWVKKNPAQLLKNTGLFNPIKEHRYARTMRRHKALIELLFKATRHRNWLE